MFFKIYKHFLFIYFLLGLSPYFTLKPKTTKYEKVFRFVPCCISVTITVCLFIYSFATNRTIFLVYGKINDFIAYSYLLALIAFNLSGSYQCIRYHNVYFDLMKRIHRTDRFSHLSSHKSHRLLRKQILVKCLLILATYSTAILVLFLNNTTVETIFFKIELVVLQLGCSMNTMHTIMYIDIVRSHLNINGKFMLNAALSYGEMCTKRRYLNLKSFKKIYFDWWNIMQQINIYFGWSLLAFLIKCFVEVSYTLYFYFLMLQTGLDALTILRKHLSRFYV